MDQTVDRPGAAPAAPQVNRVDPGQPLVWLQRGWADLRRAALPSLIFGAWTAAFGFALLLVAWRFTYLAPALVGGFLLVAPFVAIYFYALSEQIERGQTIDGALAAFAWRRNTQSIALWGLVLALTMLLWERIAAIAFALLYHGPVGDFGSLTTEILFSGGHLPLLAAFFGVGGLLALAVFAFGIVTAPMLVDRDVDVVTAALTSLLCCLRNPGAALLWAFIIALLTLIGFATLLLGLLIIFPLLGHASWHAYRDLVR
jgi:uncharacterized membrane protein